MNVVSLTSLLLAFITSGAPVAGSDAFPINISFLTGGPDENAENAYHACADIIAVNKTNHVQLILVRII